MNFLKSLVQKFTGRPVDWDELEAMLIRSDLGVPMTLRIIEALRARAERATITSNDISEVARDEIGRILPMAPLPITPHPARPRPTERWVWTSYSTAPCRQVPGPT